MESSWYRNDDKMRQDRRKIVSKVWEVSSNEAIKLADASSSDILLLLS